MHPPRRLSICPTSTLLPLPSPVSSSVRRPSASRLLVRPLLHRQAGRRAGICPSVCLWVSPSISLSDFPSIRHSSVRSSVRIPPPSVGLFFRSFVRSSVHQSSLSVHPCVTSFTCPSSYRSVCSPVRPYVSPSVRPSAHYQGIIMIPF